MNTLTIFCLMCNSPVVLYKGLYEFSSSCNHDSVYYRNRCHHCSYDAYYQLKVYNKYSKYFNLNNNNCFYDLVLVMKNIEVSITKYCSRFDLYIYDGRYTDSKGFDVHCELDKPPTIEYIRTKINSILLLS